jgi:glycosyltransferase involved in cell wall biosynthesis
MSKFSRTKIEFNKLKVALVYDRVNKFGGAERVLLSLHKIFPEAPLYTLVYEPSKAPWAKTFTIIPSFFNQIPFVRNKHEWLTLVAPLGFESFNFNDFDLVISITSTDAKAIITKPGTLHACYCLTPTRYLWNLADTYSHNPGFKILDWLVRPIFHLFKKGLQKRDLVFASRPDEYITIANVVKDRVKKYYNRDSLVVYPGINFNFWSAIKNGLGEYYLLVSRLVPYKKADLVVETFNRLGKPLKVVGIGSQLDKLKSIAKNNIEFLGAVDDEQLRSLYANAKALIFPQEEDFGLVPLEAQAAGTPVIAYDQGGANETVIGGKTGIFFKEQSIESLKTAVVDFENQKYKAEDCQENAKQFDELLFSYNFRQALETLISKRLNQ